MNRMYCIIRDGGDRLADDEDGSEIAGADGRIPAGTPSGHAWAAIRRTGHPATASRRRAYPYSDPGDQQPDAAHRCDAGP